VIPKIRGFYGWIALAGAALVFFTTSGAFYYSYGVFLPTICNEYCWSRTLVGGVLTVALLVFGVAQSTDRSLYRQVWTQGLAKKAWVDVITYTH
jgi:hypothetical protein